MISRLWPLLCLLACADPNPAATASAHSATWLVEQIFSVHFFDAEARRALMTPRADEALRLPGLIEQDRYRFLQVTELRRVDETHRVGEVAFAIDGWPAQLGVELTRTPEGWRLSGVDPPETQQVLVEVLGIKGLPRARTAEPWPGGLAGRDAGGRPTSAALVLVTSAGIRVDGQPLPDEPTAVKAAIAAALAARQQLAWVAHATYRPHVAIALPGNAPAPQHARIARWAVEAGAEALVLVVRDPQGGPAFLPLARAEPVPVGEVAPLAIEVLQTPAGARLATGAETAEVPLGDDIQALRPAVTRLQSAAPAVAFLLTPDPKADHSQVVALLDALRTASPGLPIASREPQ